MGAFHEAVSRLVVLYIRRLSRAVPASPHERSWRATLRTGSQMTSSLMRRARWVFLLILVCPFVLAATQKQGVTIKEWPVPWPDTHPSDPFVAGPDTVWFVGSTGHYLATLNPQTGAFQPKGLIDEPGPQRAIVQRDG